MEKLTWNFSYREKSISNIQPKVQLKIVYFCENGRNTHAGCASVYGIFWLYRQASQQPDNSKFFLMQSERYGSDAEGVVLAEDGSVVVDGCREFDEKTVNQIRIFLHPPPETKKPDAKPEETSVKISEEENCWPISENAEEVHNKKTAEEQQMDEIERRINSLPEPRTINGRVSVLDRLHIIQAKRAIREGKKPPRIGAEQKVKR
ncbi:MAG: hypothetical protein LUG83_10920, partial [Lachnospiraceae bacterium]|nr:hypothetical protein [Lachnospiraceae bacterium]